MTGVGISAAEIGDMAKSISNIEELGIPAEDKAKILGGNGKKILKLKD